MNLVLFAPDELDRPLPRRDDRAQHLLKVLRCGVGETFDVGVENGPRGKATLLGLDADELRLSFVWAHLHPPPATTALALGLPRPQTARDVLRDATTLGATALHFVRTARSDPNYGHSSLWTSGEWQRHVRAGAAQAFDTHLPDVTWHHSLADQLRSWQEAKLTMIALDVYGADSALDALSLPAADTPVALLLGPERGWDDADRAVFDRCGASRHHLGPRVLRTETAVVAALTLLNAARRRA